MHFKLSTKQCPSSDDEKQVPYASAIGSMMYTMICTRSNIIRVVGIVSCFLPNPERENWNAVKWIMKYLCATSSLSLCFGSGKLILCGYTDPDMVGDVDTHKSISGYLITYAGGAVSWQSRLQKCVALSITKAELIAAVEACKELLWMMRFMEEFSFAQESYVLYCDSQSVIHLGKNSTFHGRLKHIDVIYNWIHDVLDSKLLELGKIHADDYGSDMMTKSLARGKFEDCCSIAGMAVSFT